MTTTENYGLKKPESNDYVSIDVINENMDVVDEKLKENADHSSNASNPHKVTAEQVGALPYHDRNLEAYNMTDLLTSGKHFEVVTIADDGTKGTPYSEGLSGVTIYTIISFATSKNNGMQIAIPSGRDNPVLFMRTFSGGMVGAWQTGFLPLEGGTLSGPIKQQNFNEYSSICKGRTVGDKTHFLTFGVAGDGYTTLEHYTCDSTSFDSSKLDGRLMIGAFGTKAILYQKNTENKAHAIFGEHNKPIGTYTGNGSATSRTINTGGLGRVAVIMSTSKIVLVTRMGALCTNCDTGAMSALHYNKCMFKDGILTIASTDAFVNTSGTEYTYQVL